MHHTRMRRLTPFSEFLKYCAEQYFANSTCEVVFLRLISGCEVGEQSRVVTHVTWYTWRGQGGKVFGCTKVSLTS